MYTFHRRTHLSVIAESIMTEDPEKAEKSFQCRERISKYKISIRDSKKQGHFLHIRAKDTQVSVEKVSMKDL